MFKFENLKAHLMMEFNASKQIKQHSKLAIIITTFESNSRASKFEPVELAPLFVKTWELILSD
jgi:hypothetical protein